jgi:hypothetical protein
MVFDCFCGRKFVKTIQTIVSFEMSLLTVLVRNFVPRTFAVTQIQREDAKTRRNAKANDNYYHRKFAALCHTNRSPFLICLK